ncbi:MAG TPA: cytidylate kinase family protein, partial [Candidatus Methylacidiphilales bacterium]
ISALNVLSPGEARTRARQLDDARARFVERFFHRDIADPVGYDLVLNTDRLSLAKAARLAAALVAGPSRGAATGGTPSPTKERQSPALRLG